MTQSQLPPAAEDRIQGLFQTIRRFRQLLRMARFFTAWGAFFSWVFFGLLFAFFWELLCGVGFFSGLLFWLVILSSFSWVLYRWIYCAYRDRLGDKEASYILEKSFPQFDSRLISSIQLEEARADNQIESLALLKSLQEETALELERTTWRKVIPWQRMVVWLGTSFLLWGGILFTGHFFKKNVSDSFFAFLRVQEWILPQGGSSKFSLGKKLGWAVGDIRLTYFYPKYTGLSMRTEVNTDGSIRALKGTLVRMEARSSSPLKEAQLQLESGVHYPLKIAEQARTILGEFILTDNDSYKFVVGVVGRNNKIKKKNSRLFPIEVIPDGFPKINLDEPLKDIEINKAGTLDIRYQAFDDFGLTRVTFVVVSVAEGVQGEREKPQEEVEIKKFKKNIKEFSESYRLDLAPLELKAGQNVKVFLRIYDNDTVSGPKFTDSAVRNLSILSAQKIQEESIDKQEEIWEEMIQSLGDHLDFSLRPTTETSRSNSFFGFRSRLERMRMRLETILGSMEQIIKSLKQNPIEGKSLISKAELKIQAMEGIHRGIERVEVSWAKILMDVMAPENKEAWQSKREELIDNAQSGDKQLERAVLLFERLIMEQKTDALLLESQGLFEKFENFKDRMENLSSENLDEAIQLLEEMEQAYHEFLKKLAQTQAEIPLEDFINLDALKELQKESVDGLLQEIQKLLKEGKIEEAKALMEKLQKKMEEISNKVKISSQEKQEEMAQKLVEAIEKLDEVIKNQERLVTESEKLKKSMQDRLKKEQLKGYKDFLNIQLKRIKSAQKSLKEFRQGIIPRRELITLMESVSYLEKQSRESLKSLEKNLKEKNIDGAREKARETLNLIERLQANSEALHRFSRLNEEGKPLFRSLKPLENSAEKTAEVFMDLNQFLTRQSQEPNAREKKKMSQFEKGQEGIRKRSMKLVEDIGELSKELPFLSQDMFGEGEGEERMPEMKNAAQKLKNGDISGAIPQERSGLYRLKDAREKMQQALQQAQQEGGQGQGMGLPQGVGGLPPGRGENGKGRAHSKEEVDIPGEEDFQSADEFRREVLDAMKKPAPRGYDQLNRDYYEELLR